MADMDAGDLSLGARLLLRMVRGYTSGICWASQHHLAEQMGRSVRSVRNYLRELEQAGLVQTSRQQRNVVKPAGVPAVAQSGKPLPVSGKILPVEPAALCRSNRQPIAGALRQPTGNRNEKSEQREKSSGGSTTHPAAAAAPHTPPQDLVRELVHRGVPAAEANALAIKPVEFVRLVLAYHAELRAIPKKLISPTGALKDMLRFPAKWDFVEIDGVWQPPADSLLARQRRERQRRDEEQAERQRRRDEDRPEKSTVCGTPQVLRELARRVGLAPPRPTVPPRAPPPGVDRARWIEAEVAKLKEGAAT